MDSSHPQDDFSSRFFIWHEWIKVHTPSICQPHSVTDPDPPGQRPTHTPDCA
ncbi:hypothetical protein JB92DRAFT_3012994 [Gautieria morchelliformis]|nr:hypothetical protein JB92DRAFT_3012994 [Gautieria morchelliformis]